MKKYLLAMSVFLAITAPSAFAQPAAPAPAGSASATATNPATLAAARDMLASMNYRAVAQGMFAQMREAIPTMIRQGAEASINNSPTLDAAKKEAALDKMNRDLPQAITAIDGIFNDPAVLDEIMSETAQLYARHFSVTELHQIAAFYKTPVGAKMLATMPQLTGESMEMSQRIVMPRIAAIMQKIQPEAAPK